MQRIRRASRLAVASAAAGLALATAGLAIADMAGSPSTDPVAARLEVRVVEMERQFCSGDGSYYQAQAVHKGTLTGDPRVSGDATLYSRFLGNMDNGRATNTGKLVVRDPETKRKKLEGDYWSVPGTSSFKGVLVARIPSQTGEPDGTLIANFTAYATGDGRTIAEFGNSDGDDGSNPALIQSGGCPIPAATE